MSDNEKSSKKWLRSAYDMMHIIASSYNIIDTLADMVRLAQAGETVLTPEENKWLDELQAFVQESAEDWFSIAEDMGAEE